MNLVELNISDRITCFNGEILLGSDFTLEVFAKTNCNQTSYWTRAIDSAGTYRIRYLSGATKGAPHVTWNYFDPSNNFFSIELYESGAGTWTRAPGFELAHQAGFASAEAALTYYKGTYIDIVLTAAEIRYRFKDSYCSDNIGSIIFCIVKL